MADNQYKPPSGPAPGHTAPQHVHTDAGPYYPSNTEMNQDYNQNQSQVSQYAPARNPDAYYGPPPGQQKPWPQQGGYYGPPQGMSYGPQCPPAGYYAGEPRGQQGDLAAGCCAACCAALACTACLELLF